MLQPLQLNKSAATSKFGHYARPLLFAVIAMMTLGIGLYALSVWRSAGRNPTAGANAATDNESVELRDTVHLSSERRATITLTVEPVRLQTIQDIRTVAGKIGYHPGGRLQLSTPVAAVIKRVLVAPGDVVKAGAPLAVLVSDELGTVRDDVATRQSELRQAEKELDWTQQIHKNLAALLVDLQARMSVDDAEQKYRDQLLGEHRESVLSAYSKLLLAERRAAVAQPLADQGTLSVRLIEERLSERQIARTNFASVCEQAQITDQRQLHKHRLAVEHAARVLAVTQQKLASLLGPFAQLTGESGQLCELTLYAPSAAIVEQRLIVEAGRVVVGQHLLTLTNTDRLWVSAEIYEHDWLALENAPQQEVLVRPTALDGAEFKLKVQFVGLSVSSESRTVPIVAELPNTQHQFKPGMFVRVSIPVGQAREALAVPSGAVMHHDGLAFVFVEQQPGEYRRVDVGTGLETPERIEILHGLAAGDRVVGQGAFVLKSELLLEREVE